MSRAIRFTALCLTSATLVACGADSVAPDAPQMVTSASLSAVPVLGVRTTTTTAATVRFVPIEGGCWVLVTPTGERYLPVNLPQAYRVRGMAVTVVFRPTESVGGICQIAPHVVIVNID